LREVRKANLEEINFRKGNRGDLGIIYDSYKNCFPENERKSRSHLEMLIASGRYQLLIATNHNTQTLAGFAFIFVPENLPVIWLDYICIEPYLRSLGLGTLFLRKIIEFEGKGKDLLLLELESPDRSDAVKERRIKFYEQAGALCLPFKYIYPTVNGAADMLLYAINISNKKIYPEIIKDSIKAAFDFIHSDVDNRFEILAEILNNISVNFQEMEQVNG